MTITWLFLCVLTIITDEWIFHWAIVIPPYSIQWNASTEKTNKERCHFYFLVFLDEVVLSVVIFIVDMGVQINPDCRLVTSRWNFLFKLGHFIHVFGNSQSCVLSSAVMSSFMPSQRLTDKVVLTALTEDEPACDKIMTMWGGHIITISTARGWK